MDEAIEGEKIKPTTAEVVPSIAATLKKVLAETSGLSLDSTTNSTNSTEATSTEIETELNSSKATSTSTTEVSQSENSPLSIETNKSLTDSLITTERDNSKNTKTELLDDKADESLSTTLFNAFSNPVVGAAPFARSSPISREFLALQKSLNESKILTEFVADTSAIKTARKGRKSGATNAVSGITGSRDNSFNKSHNRNRGYSIDPIDVANEDRALGKRNMRSQNSEFAQRHMEFLNRVIQQQQSGDEQYGSELDDSERLAASGGGGGGSIGIAVGDDEDEQIATSSNSGAVLFDLADVASLEARFKGFWQPPPKRGWDSFCWRCRDCGGATLIPCSKCLRCFHKNCIKVSTSTKFDNSWHCPECLAVENALNSPKKTRRPDVSLDMLSELLNFALKRMRSSKGKSKFLFTDGDYSYLSKFIVNPVTFSTLEEKIAKKAFRCPEEFYNETKWMVHNAHIITTGFSNNKLLVTAKAIVKICRQETNEIETCSGCYLSANTRSDWFVDVCAQPHMLLWAKLKGFPYWPAKAMGIGQNAVVNVRFFGKHDRAFVPIKDCFLYSQQDPNMQTGKRSQRELADCIKEVQEHIQNIEAKIGKFNFAPFKTPYDPNEEMEQLELMMPGVAQYIKRQQLQVLKPSLQYKIVKTAGNHLSIVRKGNSTGENKVNLDEIEIPSMETAELTRKDSKTSISSSGSSDTPKHSTTSTKYEVITKTTSNDSDSPKVNAVILKKRKTYETTNERCETLHNDNADIESSTIKMPKICMESVAPTVKGTSRKESIDTTSISSAQKGTSAMAAITGSAQHTIKRKQQQAELSAGETSADNNVEKHKSKHARIEPRLPILTIKTGSAKIFEQSARDVVEHLSKSNTCVTIKKVTKVIAAEQTNTDNKEPSQSHASRPTRSSLKETTTIDKNTTPPTETSISTVTATATKAESAGATTPPKSTTMASNAQQQPQQHALTALQQKKEAEKQKLEEERNIFRELVPFVEVKREITSDDEAAANEENSFLNQMSTTSSTNTIAAIATIIPTAQTLQATDKAQIPPLQSKLTITNVVAPQMPTEVGKIEPMRIRIKEEVMSDDESNTATLNVVANNNNSRQEAVGPLTTIHVPTNADLQDSHVRVVGGTTIQRLSTKNAALAQTTVILTKPTSMSPTSTNTATTIVTATTQNTGNSKRITTRSGGVPYGPLPASAATLPTLSSTTGNSRNTLNASNEAQNINIETPQFLQQQQQQLHQSQRARKSFPNPSPPNSIITSSPSISMLAANSPPIAVTANAELRRGSIMKTTSMVSIPADIAAQRNMAQNSIPMPPLTAVSKTLPVTATVTNTIAGVTTNLVGTITPTVFTNNNNVNNNNNNNNVNNTISNVISINANNNTNNNNNNNNNLTNTINSVASNNTNNNNNNNNNNIANSNNFPQVINLLPPPPLAGLSTFPNNTTTPNIVQLQQPVAVTMVNTLSATNVVTTANINNKNNSNNSNNKLCNTLNMEANNAVSTTENHLLGDFVTPALANAITEVICRGPPKMAPRPNGPLQSDGSTMFPSEAGPVCRTLVQNAHKLTDFFISVMEDTMCEMTNNEEPSLQAKITLLTMELERTKQAHEQEIAELKRTSDLMLCEMRKSMENEKTRIANEIRKQCELERLRCVEEAKRKQWCANCGREAQFYCCWNTSYCDYPCQQQHWSRHAASCAQTRPHDNAGATAGSHSLQPVITSASSINPMAISPDMHRNKSSTSASAAVQYNKNVMNSKKDKHNVGSAMSSTTGKSSMTTNAVTSEVLKLPNNTSLRPVATNSGGNGNNNQSRVVAGFNTQSPAQQRYNISLPISTTPAVNPRAGYTIVQRGNSYELMTTTSNAIQSMNTINTVTVAHSTGSSMQNMMQQQAQMPTQQQHQQQQQQQQQRLNIGLSRNRGVSIMTYNTASNGNLRSTQM